MSGAFLCKFVLSWVLVSPLQIDGLALATGLSYLCWGGLMFVGIRRAQRPSLIPLVVYFLKVSLLVVGGGLLGHYLTGLVIPGIGDDILLGRLAHLAIGVLGIWGPLLLIEGHWGIHEGKNVWQAFTTAIRRS